MINSNNERLANKYIKTEDLTSDADKCLQEMNNELAENHAYLVYCYDIPSDQENTDQN